MLSFEEYINESKSAKLGQADKLSKANEFKDEVRYTATVGDDEYEVFVAKSTSLDKSETLATLKTKKVAVNRTTKNNITVR